MDLLDTMLQRRSVRRYTELPVTEEQLDRILAAGLSSASSRGRKPWELIVVTKRDTLNSLAQCRQGAAEMLKGASAAIVVIGDPDSSDVWVEDCSIVMTNMHLMASSMGLGSCWIQGRLRQAPDGTDTDTYVKELLNIPASRSLEAILSIGNPAVVPDPAKVDELPWQKVHRECF